MARIIPARAGFTRGVADAASVLRDHPRSRGVYGRIIHQAGKSAGSSPLARGLHAVGGVSEFFGRIIPARAGFTRVACGIVAHWKGSSPLARGLLSEFFGLPSAAGIIPARAGFTSSAVISPFSMADHPRSRGVYLDFVPRRPNTIGSSPLARGLPRSLCTGALITGIIPARAGFTNGLPDTAAELRDHPRSRGVYVAQSFDWPCAPGSSPLARGLHLAIGVIPTVGHPTRGRSPSLVT